MVSGKKEKEKMDCRCEVKREEYNCQVQHRQGVHSSNTAVMSPVCDFKGYEVISKPGLIRIMTNEQPLGYTISPFLTKFFLNSFKSNKPNSLA